MSARYFVFLYIEDHRLSRLFDLAIYCLDPGAKWPAHVTLAGPFVDARSVPRNLSYERRVSVIGAEQFRSEAQNTVYLRVGALDMRSVWNKGDFPYNPHITLYDGLNHDLGDELYHHLRQLRVFLKFEVSRMHVVASYSGQGSFELLSRLDPSALPQTSGMLPENFQSLDVDERVGIAVAAIRKAIEVAKKLP